MANWEELPQGILKLIACRLDIERLFSFWRGCTSWQSAATKETYKAKSKTLWLMTHAYNNTAKFSSISTGRIYPARLPGSLAQILSALGWILVSEGASEYRIFNPLSRISIELPALEKLHRESCLSVDLDGLKKLWYGPRGIDMMALSSSPSLSRSYTVIISYTGSPWFAFHRSGEDAWTVESPATHLLWCTVLQLIYCNGLFVALDEQSRIMTLNERKSRMESRLVLGLNCYVDGDPYLVECSGSLLVAWKIWSEMYGGPMKEIRVLRVDLEKGTEEEVKSLGNVSLFLSGNSSLSMEFNAESCLPGIKPNHVYFPDYEDDKMKSYSMEDGKVETYFDATSRHIYEAQWFQPDF